MTGAAQLVLVGNPESIHVGAHFAAAARAADVSVAMCDVRAASDGPVWSRKFNWAVRGQCRATVATSSVQDAAAGIAAAYSAVVEAA